MRSNEYSAGAFCCHFNAKSSGDSHMDKNRIDGAAKEIKGATKEAFGKVTGNTGKQVAGKVEKTVGKAQRKIGEAADKGRGERNI